MGAHHVRHARVGEIARKRERRVEDMLDAAATRAVDGVAMDLCRR